MARLEGIIRASHVPAIGKAIARGMQEEPYWKPFFDGFIAVRAWLDRVRPNAAILIYNDHGLNFFLDKMPTFALGAAPEHPNQDEGWGLPTLAPFPGDPTRSWHLINSLIADEFDLTTCQELLVDHAFAVPMQLLWPQGPPWPIRMVPLCINTVQHPLPSAHRCYSLGLAIGRAIETYNDEERIVIIGTGGLSHQLDGERAGFINKEFDRYCLDKLVHEPEALLRYSNAQLVELAGTQGVEILMWIAARGALRGGVAQVHRHYHVPSRTPRPGYSCWSRRPRGTSAPHGRPRRGAVGAAAHDCTIDEK